MRRCMPISCYYSYLVSDILKSHARGIERGSLFRVSNMEFHVIESVEHANGGLNDLIRVEALTLSVGFS